MHHQLSTIISVPRDQGASIKTFSRIVDEAVSLLRDVDAPTELVIDYLEKDRDLPIERRPTQCPHPEILTSALEHTVPRTEKACALIESVADRLVWFAPPPEVPEVVGERTIAAEFFGPHGTIVRPQYRFGVFAQAAHTRYPPHWHAADEFYVVIGGEAQWTVGDRGPEVRGPGSTIHIESLAEHQTVTIDQPTLAFYSWTGDIGFETYQYRP